MIGTTDTDRSGQTFTRVAVKLGSGKIHYARKYDGWGVSPQCGGNRASERYRVVNQDVDCLRCLKLLAAEEAAEQAHQDRVDASMQPATGEGDYLAPAAKVEKAEAPAERRVSVDMQSPTQGIVLGHGVDGFQGFIGDDGEGAFYAESPYTAEPWHQGGFNTPTAAADALARHIGFTGTNVITVTREYSAAVPVTSQVEPKPPAAEQADPSRVAGDAEEAALAAALSSAGIAFTPEQLSAAATTLTAQQPAADLAEQIRAAIDLGDAEWMRCDNGPDAESTALRTIEAIRQLVAPGSKMRLPEPPAATEVRIVMDSDSVGSAWLNGTEYAVFRGLSSWGVVGTGIRGNSLDGIGKALARRRGITGPVTTTVVPPKD